MNVRVTLTDAELPPSDEFLEFLDDWLSEARFDGSSWAVLGQERSRSLGSGTSRRSLLEQAERIAGSDAGLRHVARSYELLAALFIGDIDTLRAVQEKFRFVLIVGFPRSGGKYVTKEYFRALGHDPTRVPAVLGHDGFPDAAPWRFDRSGNGWVNSFQSMAEYLTMVEIFFRDANPHGGSVIVPKKATKAAYAAGLFQTALGHSAEGVITVRHPVPSCISAYEAVGGLPERHRFTPRGNIEQFCARDLINIGFTPREVEAMDYFDAYLRYWEDYHVRLAMGGSNMTRNYRVLAYGAERYMREVRRFAERAGGPSSTVESFYVNDTSSRHPEWMDRAGPAIRRVSEQWERVGLNFPVDEIAEAW